MSDLIDWMHAYSVVHWVHDVVEDKVKNTFAVSPALGLADQCGMCLVSLSNAP